MVSLKFSFAKGTPIIEQRRVCSAFVFRPEDWICDDAQLLNLERSGSFVAVWDHPGEEWLPPIELPSCVTVTME